MKPSLKLLPALLICLVLTYTACKNAAVKPVAATTIDTKALSSQIALSFYQSLTGKYGGANINDGIKAPSAITLNHKGPVINGVTSLCGYTIDTAYSTNATAGDTAKTFAGHFKFVYTCTTDKVDGYTMLDSLTNTEKGTKFSNTFIMSQNYTAKALDQTYKLFSVDGSIYSSIVELILGTTPGQYHDITSTYKLAGLKIDVSSGIADITMGTATFTTVISDLDPSTPITGTTGGFTGTIEFLGGHKAKLTLQRTGSTTTYMYTVDLLTGVVTAI